MRNSKQLRTWNNLFSVIILDFNLENNGKCVRKMMGPDESEFRSVSRQNQAEINPRARQEKSYCNSFQPLNVTSNLKSVKYFYIFPQVQKNRPINNLFAITLYGPSNDLTLLQKGSHSILFTYLVYVFA